MTPRITAQQPKIIPPEILLGAYATGYFPMAGSQDGEISWYSPDPRAIIPLETFLISRSLRQTIKKRLFEIKYNTSFETVIRSCGERKDTWISEEIVQSYLQLSHLGYAHSVEAWREDQLAGGLYGVSLGGAFFGESMFSRERDSSKVALVALVERLRDRKFRLLDTQFVTPHLAHFGTTEIPREEYLHLLHRAVRLKRSFTD